MNPEHAPSSGDATGTISGGDNRTGGEHEAAAPPPPKERGALRTVGDPRSSPVDRSMLESIGATDRTDAPTTPDTPIDTPVGASISADGSAYRSPDRSPDRSDAESPPPAHALAKPKKKRRKRRRPKVNLSDLRPQPPIPLDPVAHAYWNRLILQRDIFNVITDFWLLARYCSYLSLWVATRQVLDSKGLIYVRHQRAKGNDPPPVESIRALPHADYLIRLEYVLFQHERALGLDRHDVFTTTTRQVIPSPRPGTQR